MLATAGADGVRLWDVATGAARGRVGDGSSIGAVAFSPAAPLVAIVVAGYPDPDEEAGVVEVWNVTRRSLVTRLRPDLAPDVIGYALAFSPGRPDARQRRIGDRFVHLWDVEKRKAAPRARAERAAACTRSSSAATVVPWRSGGTESRMRRSSTSRRGHRSARGSRPAETQRRWSMCPLTGAPCCRRTATGRGLSGTSTRSPGRGRACALANRTLTQEEWKKFLPGRPYKPACGAETAQGRIDQVKRVSAAGGARPPGRRPRRTSSVGGAASRASLRRAGPRPSRCHRVDSPTTSRPASRLASSMPSSPGGVSSGSAEMPRTRWTASAPCESRRLASRLPCSGTAAAPASRSGASVGARKPRAELDRRPVVLGPSERDEHGAFGRRVPRNEQRHVAGRLRKEGGELLVGSSLGQELVGGVGEQEIDVELGREPSQFLARRRRRERGCTGHDTARFECRPALLEPGRRGLKRRLRPTRAWPGS